MTRYAWLIVLLGTYSICVAQPMRLWKRDGHSSAPHVVGVERSTNRIYTASGQNLYLWDRNADTVVRRVVLDFQQENRADILRFVDDTTVFVGKPGANYGYFNALTGAEISRKPNDLPMEWVDDSLRIAVGFRSHADTQFVVISDPRTFTKRTDVVWKNGKSSVRAYDYSRKQVYCISNKKVFAIDTLGSSRVVCIFNGEYEDIGDVQLTKTGQILVFLYIDYPDRKGRIISIDPDTYIHTDSVDLTGSTYWLEGKRVHVLADNRLLVRASSEESQFVSLSPLRTGELVEVSSYADYYESPGDTLLFYAADQKLMGIDTHTSALSVVLERHSKTISATQLNTDQLVLGLYRVYPQVVSIGTGRDLYPLFPTQRWNYYDVMFNDARVLAASHAPVVLICGGGSCRTLTVSDTAWSCSKVGVGTWMDGYSLDFAPVWVDSNGTRFQFQYLYDPWPHRSLYGGTAIGFASSPCDTSYVQANPTGVGISEKSGWPTIERVSVSRDGLMTLFKGLGSGIREDNGMHFTYLKDPNNILKAKYPNSTHGVVMNNGVHGVMDDTNGIVVIDARYPGFSRRVDLGQRHLPLQRMQTSELLLTYANNAIHCVDFTTARILWSMPVANHPTSILVDRNDRWFLCQYAEDYCEMFALDATVNVSEDGSTNASLGKGQQGGLSVYPNPMSGTLSIRAPYPMLDYALYDVIGNRVLSEVVDVQSRQCTLNTSALTHGNYVLVANTIHGRLTIVVSKCD